MSNRVLWTRKKPNIDADIRPFWDACAEHRLVLMRCKTCGAMYWPATMCRNEHELEPYFRSMEWVTVSGRGKVGEWNMHYVAFDPTLKDDIPYVYAMIETEEGPYISGNILGVTDPSQISIGMSVEVTFVDIVTPDGEEFTLPQWTLVDEPAA